MAETKTQPTGASVEDYLASRATDGQRVDCLALMVLLKKVTKKGPMMWGASIVGYGSYDYTYASGRTGTTCLTGFAIRGREIVIYLAPYWNGATGLLVALGSHKMGKGCLYFKRLADLDQAVLEQPVVGSVAELHRRYGQAGTA
ncbi:hypothetical protein LPB72_18900 [Hydrogenophaga crassostreae]|uniref:YdhG-like domain-containing protein n=1 Tax=Hydrogenophaga crassostreae TaxID=1763535 RepID=A0A162STN3_9BURK|nr:DUF1801 domain-containing protein [Hydrogenophaga crassostreae]AOW13030.1 hypothetical protein LPB072_09405 [Hydrogenophaga crassostreae]OAD40214.1 hypothetical protein LPB72_18900 [Hydrogenophaga crassostreae]